MTYKQIQYCFHLKFNRTIKSCWIADVKRRLGLKVRNAHNRQSATIINRCPEYLVEKISQIINGHVNCN